MNETKEQLIDDRFETIQPVRGFRRILTDACLIWTTVMVTVASISIIAYVTRDYYQLCLNDTQNRTECAQ